MNGPQPERPNRRPFSSAAEVLANIRQLEEQHPDRIQRDSLDNIIGMLARSEIFPPELEMIGEEVFMKGLQALAASLRYEEIYSGISLAFQKAAIQAEDFLYFVARVDQLIASFPAPKTEASSTINAGETQDLSDGVAVLITALKGIAADEDSAVTSEDFIDVLRNPETTRKDLDAIRRVTRDFARSIIKDSKGADSYLRVAVGYLELSIRAERASQERFGL